MPFQTYRRARPTSYKRVCQCCRREISDPHTYVNYAYTLLCRFCFWSNPVTERVMVGSDDGVQGQSSYTFLEDRSL